MREHRIQNRFLCAELARVSWMVGPERHQTDEAILEDICSTGGCVQLEQPISIGSAIMLTFRGQQFDGKVRHCLAGEFGFFIGIKFAADTPWSQHLAVPAHLTNVDAVTMKMDASRAQ